MNGQPLKSGRKGGTGNGTSTVTTAQRTRSSLILVLGVVFLLLSAAMSLLLVLEHLGGLSLPGCGEGGPCAQAANSVWGKLKIGGFEWPVSYLGLAYFLAMLVVWIRARAGLPQLLRYVVRLGALVSLGFCLVILLERTACSYCLASHAGNFAFWITMELTKLHPSRARPATAYLGAVFVLVTIILGLWDAQHRAMVRGKAEEERGAATREIIERAAQEVPSSADSEEMTASQAPGVTAEEPSGSAVEAPAEKEPQAVASPPDPDAGAPPATTPAEQREAPQEVDTPREDSRTASPQIETRMPVFAGRYRVGPEEAPIRIVIFTDYQCRDCYQIEQQLKELRDTRDDLSISVKHFPFNKDCNPYVEGTLHGNACWAARAAETAGMLWGPEGFWKMHVWLFSRRGSFQTTQELEEGIRGIGYDPTGFALKMTSQETLAPIRADIEEAKELGLHFTPMIFINGVELKGWSAPNALVRTVEEIAATNPPARSAAHDRPPRAFAKYVADWREEPKIVLPVDDQARVVGPKDATVRITMWGDYQEAGTVEADSVIRAFSAKRVDVRYAYRHYPVNSDCNPNLKDKRHPHACRAALAAEAAGRLGGAEAYWKMHVWLMKNRVRFSNEALRQAAAGFGLDADTLLATMERPDLGANIREDVQAGTQLPRLRYGMPAGIYAIPTIFVNDRFVPRWQLDEQPILETILSEAAGK